MSTRDRTSTTDAVARDGHEDDPQALREQIEQTRAELGDTVQALSEKTDVKARTSERVQDTKQQVHDTVDASKARARANQVPIAVAAGGALAFVILAIVWSRRS